MNTSNSNLFSDSGLWFGNRVSKNSGEHFGARRELEVPFPPGPFTTPGPISVPAQLSYLPAHPESTGKDRRGARLT